MKKIFVIFIVFSLFISSLCAIDGCKTLAEGGATCTTCEDGYLKVADNSKCLYGCATEGASAAAGTCATCSSGYLITGAKTCIKGCKTAEDNPATSAKCKACTTEANLSTDGLSCIANCKTTGHNSEVCSECATGYTLSTDKTSCTAETKKEDDTKEDDTKEDDKSSSFGLYSSLLIFALALLF